MEKLLVLLFPLLCLQLLATVDAGGSIDVILSGSQLQAPFMSTGGSSLVKQNSAHFAVSRKKHGHGTSLHLVKNSSHDKKSIIEVKSAREESPAMETELELFRSSGKHVNGVKQHVQIVERSGDTHVLKTLKLPLENEMMHESQVTDKQGKNTVAREKHTEVQSQVDTAMTIGQYLDKMVAYYDGLGKRVPAQAIAKIMLRMYNELSFYLSRGQSPSWDVKVELDQPVTLENFRLNTPSSSENGVELSMEGTVNIKFSADKNNNFESFADMGLDNMLLMSPEKIKHMRMGSTNADMAWLFGSVIHFLMYGGSYPLKAWDGVKLLVEKYHNQLQQESENNDVHDKIKEEFVNELRAEVQKMLENGQPLPLRDESQSFNKHFQLLATVMKECLEIDPIKRLGVQYVGGRLLKLAAGLLPWS